MLALHRLPLRVKSLALTVRMGQAMYATERSWTAPPSVNPVLDMFRERISQRVAKHLNVPEVDVRAALEVPRNAKMGDIALLLPRLRCNPSSPEARTIPLAVLEDEAIASAAASGPFVNFGLNRDLLRDQIIPHVLREGPGYGENDLGTGKRAIIEFSSPNIAKPFHAGHLRSTIIGSYIRNIHRACGYETVAMNYLGDWGKQYGLLAVGYAKYGQEEALLTDPIGHLFDVYVRINRDAKEDPEVDGAAKAYFRRMEEGDEAAIALWRRFRELSIRAYEQTYGALNVHFDVYTGESESARGVDRVEGMLRSAGLLHMDAGAEMVSLEVEGLGEVPIRRADGTSLYMTRDVAAAMDRAEKYGFDRMLYVVGTQQGRHMQQLFAILRKMGMSWAGRCEHVGFGMVRGMSTRKGDVVFLEEIITRGREQMLALMGKDGGKGAGVEDVQGTAEQLALSALIVQDMTAKRGKDYAFEWDRVLSFEGDTGPYLQYTHARLCSIERKAVVTARDGSDMEALTEPAALDLLLLVAQYPDMVHQAYHSLEPSVLVQYAFRLAHGVNGILREVWVAGQEEKLARARLAMYVSARITLGNALRIIGLTPLEKM